MPNDEQNLPILNRLQRALEALGPSVGVEVFEYLVDKNLAPVPRARLILAGGRVIEVGEIVGGPVYGDDARLDIIVTGNPPMIRRNLDLQAIVTIIVSVSALNIVAPTIPSKEMVEDVLKDTINKVAPGSVMGMSFMPMPEEITWRKLEDAIDGLNMKRPDYIGSDGRMTVSARTSDDIVSKAVDLLRAPPLMRREMMGEWPVMTQEDVAGAMEEGLYKSFGPVQGQIRKPGESDAQFRNRLRFSLTNLAEPKVENPILEMQKLLSSQDLRMRVLKDNVNVEQDLLVRLPNAYVVEVHWARWGQAKKPGQPIAQLECGVQDEMGMVDVNMVTKNLTVAGAVVYVLDVGALEPRDGSVGPARRAASSTGAAEDAAAAAARLTQVQRKLK